MGGCITSDYEDPNILYNKTKVATENGSVKYAKLQNGVVDSNGNAGSETTKESVLKGDLFMYHDAKAKRKRLLRQQEKRRDRLAQIKSSEAMDENERLSLRSQSQTTSRQTSPRMGIHRNTVHPTDTLDGSVSDGASSSKSGRQAWSPNTVEEHILEVVEDHRDTHNDTDTGKDADSGRDPIVSVLPNQCENHQESNGNTANTPANSGLENSSAAPTTDDTKQEDNRNQQN